MRTVDKIFGYFGRLAVSDALILKLAVSAVFIFGIWFLVDLSAHSRVNVPTRGGALIEGIVGTPRFVNPVLAVTHADKDLSGLIYDGLMKLGIDGTLSPHIAESVTVSEDGLTYNVVLKRSVQFHDNTPLTARDVAFTVGRIQASSLASPLRAVFEGVLVEQIGEYELNFVLEKPYSPFMENLSFGILPEHLWKDASNEEFPFSQLNSEPVGSGPYRILKIVRNASGIPDSYKLEPFAEYHLGQPRIEEITLNFYPNDEKLIEAFKAGEIDSIAGIDQKNLFDLAINTDTHTIIRIPQPRTFGIFFNQNKSPALRDLSARRALDTAIDRTTLVDIVLGGYGQGIESPIPPGFGIDIIKPEHLGETAIENARGILRNAGWKLNSETGMWEKNIDGTLTPLTFSVSTANTPVFEATAEYVRTTWEKLGVPITIKQFEQSDLTQAIIRPRDYEALLFGAQLGRALDFFPFWHSSQRNDPGLNMSLYTNLTTDSILSQMRSSVDSSVRKDAYTKFAEEIEKESPAIFLYSTELLYVFPNSVTGASFSGIAEPQERFASIHTWFINTESVWPIFKNL